MVGLYRMVSTMRPLKPKNPAALVEMLISVTGSFSFFEAAVLACVFLRF